MKILRTDSSTSDAFYISQAHWQWPDNNPPLLLYMSVGHRVTHPDSFPEHNTMWMPVSSVVCVIAPSTLLPGNGQNTTVFDNPYSNRVSRTTVTLRTAAAMSPYHARKRENTSKEYSTVTDVESHR